MVEIIKKPFKYHPKETFNDIVIREIRLSGDALALVKTYNNDEINYAKNRLSTLEKYLNPGDKIYKKAILELKKEGQKPPKHKNKNIDFHKLLVKKFGLLLALARRYRFYKLEKRSE